MKRKIKGVTIYIQDVQEKVNWLIKLLNVAK